MWGANESSTVHRATLDSQDKESDCCRHGARDKYRKDGGDGVPGPERELRMRTIPNTEKATAQGTGTIIRFKGWQQPASTTVSMIGNKNHDRHPLQGTASTAVTGRRATW